MPSIPLPFVVALLLSIMLVRLLRRDQARADGWIVAMIALYTAQALVLGLRWGYDLHILQPVQAILAAAIPPISWLGFCSFAARPHRPLLHALPPILLALFWVFARPLVDPALELIFLLYGVALLRLAWAGTDALGRTSFGGAVPALHAMRATGLMLIASVGVDLAIALDLLNDHGRHAGLIAGLASLTFLILLGWAAILAGESAPAEVPEPLREAPDPTPAPGDATIVETLDALLRERGLHHDPNLSLDRLARRMGLPARSLSAAINRVRGMNVSQYVNGHRVADACRLLAETKTPITQVFLDVGFQTKSNFNREFLRVTGLSPSVWRKQAAGDGGPAGGPATVEATG